MLPAPEGDRVEESAEQSSSGNTQKLRDEMGPLQRNLCDQVAVGLPLLGHHSLLSKNKPWGAGRTG